MTVTFQGQGPGNKGSGSQSGILPHMQRCDEAAGLDKFCQQGTTTGKITFPPLTVLAQGELEDSSWSVQRTEARHRSIPSPALVVLLQAKARINMQTLNRGGSHNRCLQEGLWGPHEQFFIEAGGLQRRADTPTSILWNRKQCGGLSKVWGSDEGKDHLIPDRQHNSTALSVDGGKNSLQEPKCSWEEDLAQILQDWVMVQPEYPRSVEILWAGVLSRGKKAQEWSLGDPASCRLFKWWVTPGVDLPACSWAHGVP